MSQEIPIEIYVKADIAMKENHKTPLKRRRKREGGKKTHGSMITFHDRPTFTSYKIVAQIKYKKTNQMIQLTGEMKKKCRKHEKEIVFLIL